MNQYNNVEEKVMLAKLISSDHIENIMNNTELDTIPVFESVKKNIKIMEINAPVTAYGDIVTNFRLLSGIVIFIKKAIRRCLKWYIEPVCMQQSMFNCASAMFSMDMISTLEEDREKQKKEVEFQKQELENQRKEVELQKQGLENQRKEVELQKQGLENQRKEVELQKQELENQRKEIELQKQESENQRKEIELQKQESENQRKEIELQKEELLVQKNKMETLYEEVKFINEQNLKVMERVDSIKDEAFKKPVDSFWLSREVFAQSGEDIIVEYILMVLGLNISECRYLDLGANHARELSNTYSLYKKGARGVLVEANPALIPELKFYRHEDIIVNKCISEKEGDKVPLYILNGDGLVSSDKESVERALSINDSLKLESIIEVETLHINTLLEQYFVQGPEILSVDIESESLNVLKAMDWKHFRPLIVIVEMIEYSTNLNVDYKDKDIQEFMEAQGYTEYAFTGINSIYLDRDRVVKA